MPLRSTLHLLLSACSLFSTCEALSQTRPMTPAESPVNPLSSVLVLGDSASSGFQNGSLLDTQQPHGWQSLVAAQAGFRLRLPLIASPGFPNMYTLVQGTLPPVLSRANGATIGRDDQNQVVDDFATPGHTLHDILNTAPPAQPTAGSATSLVLGYPAGTTGTQVEQAIARQPSTIYLWIGNNDLLVADGMGSSDGVTSLASFTADYTQLITLLKTKTTAHLIVGNLPDVTKLPYMTSAGDLLDECQQVTGVPSQLFSWLFGIYPGELLNWQGLADWHANVERVEAGQWPVPLPPNEVLTASEIAQVQSMTDSFNQVIAQQVAAAGGTLVDLHGAMDTLARDGVTLNGYHATTHYLGGLYSLDGIHPSNTGYALFSNQFIAATNTALGLSISPVDAAAVAATDPLFGPGLTSGYTPYNTPRMSPEAGKAVDTIVFKGTVKPQ